MVKKILKYLATFLPVLMIATPAFATNIQDSVSINVPTISVCGEQQVAITGSAVYENHFRILKVYLDGNQILNSTIEPNAWNAGNYVVGTGSHTIEAKIYSSITLGLLTSDSDSFGIDECQPEPVDVCPNIDGVQTTLPDGKVLVEGQCVDPTPEPVDVCPNDEGIQTETPCASDTPQEPETPVCSENEHLDENVCVPNENEQPSESQEPTEPSAPASSPANNGGSSGSARCDRVGKPSCVDFFASLGIPYGSSNGGTSATTTIDWSTYLSQLEWIKNQLLNILNLLQTSDFKG